MDQESKVLLEKTYKLSKENNDLLHKVRKVQRRQAFWGTLKAIVFIGITLGAVYWLQPYMETLIKIFGQVSGINTQIDPALLKGFIR